MPIIQLIQTLNTRGGDRMESINGKGEYGKENGMQRWGDDVSS